MMAAKSGGRIKYSILLTVFIGLQLILTTQACENCTDDGVTKHYLLEGTSSRSNLAWLVTPALFALGVVYVIYKCCRDGLCNCRRLRERAALEHQQEHGYIPLNDVALYCTSHTAESQSGAGTRQLVLVHNQTFCVDLESLPRHGRCFHTRQAGPPTYEESVLHEARNSACPEVQVVANPPSYISSKPPRYSVAMGEVSPRPSVSEEPDAEFKLHSDSSRQLKFVANRRRHRSAQDSRTKQSRRRHFSAQDRERPLFHDDHEDDPIRQRCFSFNALKDAFKRSQNNMPECQSLLEQEGDPDSVFASREAMSSPGPSRSPPVAGPLLVTTSVITTTSRIIRRPPQQVSFEDRILEDSESNESLEQNRSHHGQSVDIRLRQRHFSAPDSAASQSKKSRHSSGNT